MFFEIAKVLDRGNLRRKPNGNLYFSSINHEHDEQTISTVADHVSADGVEVHRGAYPQESCSGPAGREEEANCYHTTDFQASYHSATRGEAWRHWHQGTYSCLQVNGVVA
jgi:hypothetical protein